MIRLNKSIYFNPPYKTGRDVPQLLIRKAYLFAYFNFKGGNNE